MTMGHSSVSWGLSRRVGAAAEAAGSLVETGSPHAVHCGLRILSTDIVGKIATFRDWSIGLQMTSSC